MSYLSRITGAIAITPPLTWAEFLGRAMSGSVTLRVHEARRMVEGEEVIARQADAIVPTTSAPVKAYALKSEAQAIVDAYAAAHTFSGYLEVSGEEQGDLWRLYVRDGRVEKVKPRLVWPEEVE